MGLEARFKIPQHTDYSGNDLLDAEPFGSLLMEYARGNISAGDALAVINFWVLTPLDTGEETDLGSLRTLIDAGATTNSKILIASQIRDVLVLAEKYTTGYITRADVKSKMGF